MKRTLQLSTDLCIQLGLMSYYSAVGPLETLMVVSYDDALEILHHEDKSWLRSASSRRALCGQEPDVGYAYLYGAFETEEAANLALTTLEMLR